MEKLGKQLKARDFPLVLGGYPYGFYGTLRYLVGEENLFYLFYDSPGLIKDINCLLADIWIEIYSKVFKEIRPDCVHFWEDMCYRGGSLVSPAMFREFMMPYYKKVTNFLKEKGVDIILVDTDGDCSELIPLFIESGVTGLYPFEVQAGMDIVEIRKKFPKLHILGGLDKRAIAQGKKEIDHELNTRLPFMLKHGGYIPFADHNIPPDVPWENFKYYRNRLREIVEKFRS